MKRKKVTQTFLFVLHVLILFVQMFNDIEENSTS